MVYSKQMNFMKVFTCILFFTLLQFFANAQNNKSDYFIKNNDTIYCTSISIYTEKEIINFDYTDLKGMEYTISNAKANNVTTISVNGQIFDLLSIKYGSKTREEYSWRKIDGKLKLYDNSFIFIEHFGHSYGSVNSNPGTVSTGGGEHSNSYLKLETDEIIFLKNDKVVREEIEPIVEKCDKFKEKYTGKYNLYDIEKIVKFYNNLCSE
jgi:hypothetical protein